MDVDGLARDGWAGTTCLVTGGLGFIGGNLARTLVSSGATVRVVDGLVPDHGGRSDQLDGVDVDRVLVASIGDPAVAELLDGVDAVFNVAGQVSHIASMRDPQADLFLNATSHAALLEMVRVVAPRARIVHTSTRQVYGRSRSSVLDESQLPEPVDVNGVAKLAGEQLHLVYGGTYGLAVTSLRLTNVYGPRQRLTSDELGFLPVFVRNALLDREIAIFGDGTQRRDCLHVADVVDAMLTAARSDRAIGRVYNVGHPDSHTLSEIAAVAVAASGSSSPIRLVPWPDELERIDVGSVRTGSDRIASELGWTATIDLPTGIASTIAFYREHPCYLSST